MDKTPSTCRHTDVRIFDSICCCLSCGETFTEAISAASLESIRPSTSSYKYEPLDFTEATSPADLEAIRPSVSSYKYEPLNYKSGQHIRLVTILPGQKQDEIVCEIFNVDLATAPPYEAVSYTWATISGDASLSQSVACWGMKLPITKNCEAAIRCLRHPSRTRILWIDAICIDQKNTTERNHQVHLMANIYANASQVLAYLGFPLQASLFVAAPVIKYLNLYSQDVMTEDVDVDLKAIQNFLQHPYFRRVWVLQEIALAKLVVLHTDEGSVNWTGHTVQMLQPLCRKFNIYTPGFLRWLPASRPEENSLLDLLHRARHCFATDPRDKVFGLFGLLHQHPQRALPVDYTLQTEQVYTNTAIHLVATTGRLDILRHVLPSHVLDLNKLPSWVPDWNVRGTTKSEFPQFTLLQKQKLATYNSTQLSLRGSPNTYAQSGSLTQEDDEIGRDPGCDSSSLWYRCQATECHHSAHTGALTGVYAGLSYLRVHAYRLDVITMPIYVQYEMLHDESFQPRDLSKESITTRGTCDSCAEKRGSGLYDSKLSVYQNQVLLEFDRMISVSSGHKQAFTTERSYGFGWDVYKCSEASDLHECRYFEPGDTIWAVNGIDVPVVLRRVDQHYVFLGQCYLHRAALDLVCLACGTTYPWPMEAAIIDIW